MNILVHQFRVRQCRILIDFPNCHDLNELICIIWRAVISRASGFWLQFLELPVLRLTWIYFEREISGPKCMGISVYCFESSRSQLKWWTPFQCSGGLFSGRVPCCLTPSVEIGRAKFHPLQTWTTYIIGNGAVSKLCFWWTPGTYGTSIPRWNEFLLFFFRTLKKIVSKNST